ncbi:LOW QUALITY PROTEIN: endothelial cell-selective adhesion molecule [Alosa sapidissima]|uniref:LOW QUALITY PROTEIN: endothelial cell-selective adhesion molecule n=1 Tax=Alosa sapidissima TaxID=34773 RepID=UPI001C09DB4A|nr:LOW QUALITY PROTEIN: endothelial cell-selective adhesion molecule [Alosa sapidissima]
METLRAGRLGALLTLAWVWSSPGDSQRVEMPRRELEVTRGQMVLLQAWYSPTSSIDRNSVIWNFMANDSKQIITFTSGQIGISPEFGSKRVGFAMPMPSTNLSIYINNTQESDTGRYLCNVLIPGAPGLSGELRLNVKVPPSPPVCSVTGRAVLKGNVTLRCKSGEGKPTPQYKWTRVAPVSEVYFSPMQNERQGTLRLNNLTKSMSGKYVCRASNTAGAESCFINLEVSAPTSASVIAGAAVGSVVGLVAIVLFLVFILRRRRDTEEEIANEIKEDAQAPKRVSWAKSGTGSDIISKNGTLSSIATSPPPHESLDQLHHHNHHLQQPPGNHYSYAPPRELPSDPAALAGYRLRPGQPNPLHGLPGYNISGSPLPSHSSPPLGHPQPSRGTHPHAHTLPHTPRPASASSSRHITANGPANQMRRTSVADQPLSGHPITANGPVHTASPRPITANGPVHTSSPRQIIANGPVHSSSPRPITVNGPVYTTSPRPITANGPVHTPSPRPISVNSQIYTTSPQPITANGPVHTPSPRPISVNSQIYTTSPQPITANGPIHASSPRPISANGPVHVSSPRPISVPSPTPDSLHRTDGAEPQAAPQTTHPQSQTLPSVVTIATLSRVGAVPVMVPSQSQAGSLV